MRVRLKGINSKRKTLADGRSVTYYYAWKGGPRLLGSPGTPEFVAAYNEAVRHRSAPPVGTLSHFLQSRCVIAKSYASCSVAVPFSIK